MHGPPVRVADDASEMLLAKETFQGNNDVMLRVMSYSNITSMPCPYEKRSHPTSPPDVARFEFARKIAEMKTTSSLAKRLIEDLPAKNLKGNKRIAGRASSDTDKKG